MGFKYCELTSFDTPCAIVLTINVGWRAVDYPYNRALCLPA